MKTLSVYEFADLCDTGYFKDAVFGFRADEQDTMSQPMQYGFGFTFKRISVARWFRQITLFNGNEHLTLYFVDRVRLSVVTQTASEKIVRLEIISASWSDPKKDFKHTLSAVIHT